MEDLIGILIWLAQAVLAVWFFLEMTFIQYYGRAFLYFDRSDTCRSSYMVYCRKFYVLSFINQKNIVPLQRKGQRNEYI